MPDQKAWWDKAWWDKRETAALTKRRCPYTSMPLTRMGEAGPDSLSCRMCDCFGYSPDDARLGPQPRC